MTLDTPADDIWGHFVAELAVVGWREGGTPSESCKTIFMYMTHQDIMSKTDVLG